MTQLEDEIRAAFAHRSSTTTADPEMGAADSLPLRPNQSLHSRHGAARYASVAAALVVVIGGAGAVLLLREDGRNPASPATLVVGTSAAGNTSPGIISTTSTGCGEAGTKVLVPNVAGMRPREATAALVESGLRPVQLSEALPAGVGASSADVVVVDQELEPGTSVDCGRTIRIVLAYDTGPLYAVRQGDTYQTIADSQGITVEQLLAFNGLTVAELQAKGWPISRPLKPGQTVRLSMPSQLASTTTFG